MARQFGLNIFLTSRQTGRIPLVLVLGKSVNATRTFLNLLLRHQAFNDSVVISAKHEGLASLQHARLIELPRLESSAQDSCLCCGLHSALGDTLRSLFFEALNHRSMQLDRVFIESDVMDTVQLAQTLKHTPFLGQRYEHQMTFRVIQFAQLTEEGIEALTGLEPADQRINQFLVCVKPPKHECLVSASQSLSPNERLVWSDRVRRSLPYRKVLFVETEADLSF